MEDLRGERWRKCQRKVAYSRQQAKKAAARQSRRKGELIKEYRCPYSNHWHIGHARQKPSD